MTYLIFFEGKAFYTNWFGVDNNYSEGMVVWNLKKHTYTMDGVNWTDITFDLL